jgi:hypothetical protein
MSEASVTDPAFAEAVIDRVAANAFRISTFNDDVAGQVGNLTTEFAASRMCKSQWLVQRDRITIDCGDDAFFRLRFSIPIRPRTE